MFEFYKSFIYFTEKTGQCNSVEILTLFAEVF